MARSMFFISPRPSSHHSTLGLFFRGEKRCHPFCRSRYHFENADGTGTPLTVAEAGFKPTTFVKRTACLYYSTTIALRLIMRQTGSNLVGNCSNLRNGVCSEMNALKILPKLNSGVVVGCKSRYVKTCREILTSTR